MTLRIVAMIVIVYSLGGLGMYWSSRKADRQTRRARWLKFYTYFLIIGVLLLAAAAGPLVFAALLLTLSALGARELLAATIRLSRGRRSAILMVAAVVAVLALEFALTSRSSRAVILCLLVCVFDGFSQIFGQLFGRTKLAPSISPSKTVEGAVGGCLAVIVFALFLDRPEVALPYALGTSGAALMGDLAASLVKRLCGIKDYSNLLPGHGGVLDRFDGLFAAAAFWAVIGLFA